MIRPIRTLLGTAEGLLDRALCVVGAVIFSQVPEFMQQYLQRLGGHLDEARRQLERLQSAAEQSNLTLEQLSAHATAAVDPAVARLGAVITETVNRVDTLAAAERAIRNAFVLARPFVFLRELDPSIAYATWSVFKPAVPTTVEGLIYAFTGMLVFLALYHLGIKIPIRRVRHARWLTQATPDI